MRCLRCHRPITETVHQGPKFRVDGYRLHTGKTKLVEIKDDIRNHPSFYLQLYDPENYYLCIDCFAEEKIREIWLRTFPNLEQIEELKK